MNPTENGDPVDEQILIEAFTQAWSGADGARMPGEREGCAGPGLGPALVALVEEGRRRWPDLVVDARALVSHVAQLMPPGTMDLPAALAALRAADLHLAFACAREIPGALQAFEQVCAVAINGTIATSAGSRSGAALSTFRTDVIQALRARLFVGSTESPPRICGYAGRGPLTAWVAITTQRVILSMVRAESNRARIEDRMATEVLAQGQDPELLYLKRRYRDDFAAAYRAAFASLSEKDVTLLRMHIIECATLERMGAVFGVDASTISRRLDRVRQAIREATEEQLRARLEVSNSEFASLARLVASQLDVSIAALFDVPAHRS